MNIDKLIKIAKKRKTSTEHFVERQKKRDAKYSKFRTKIKPKAEWYNREYTI